MNALSDIWWTQVVHATWQGTVVGVLVLAVVWLGRRLPAPLRYGLLMVGLLKFAIPPLVSLPTGVFSQIGPRVEVNSGAGSGIADATLPRASEAGTRIIRNDDSVRLSNVEARHDQPAIETTDSQSAVAVAGLTAGTDATPNPWRSWKTWILVGHLLGAAAVLAWITAQVIRLRSVTRRATAFGEGTLWVKYRKLADAFGFRSPPRLLLSPEIRSPIAFGFIRPAVLMPATAVDRLPVSELRTILAHELAHIYRRDLWVNWFQIALFVVWWFNPALWLLNRAIRRVREECCDDLLLSRNFVAHGNYCDTLVSTAAKLAARPPVGAALGFAEHLHPLGRRVARIMDRTLKRSAGLSAVGAVMVAFAGCLILPGLRSQSPVAEASDGGNPVKVAPGNQAAVSLEAVNAVSKAKFEEQFAALRYVGENNAYFEEMRDRSRETGEPAIPFLLEKLKRDPDRKDDGKAVGERRKAAMALGFIGAAVDKTVPALVRALNDDARATYSESWGGDVDGIRVNAVASSALGHIGEKAKAAVPDLIEAARFGISPALIALARIAPESPEVLQALVDAVNDNSTRSRGIEGDFRTSAIEALGIAAMKNPEAIAPIQRAFENETLVSLYQQRAAEVLVRIAADNPGVEAFVAEKIKSGMMREQAQLAAALARAGHRSNEISEILAKAVRSGDSRLTKDALDALVFFKDRIAELVPVLIEITKTGQRQDRNRAFRTLIGSGSDDPRIPELLIEGLRSPELSIRSDAFHALRFWKLGDSGRAAEPVLLELLESADPEIRRSAASAFEGIAADPQKALPALKKLLDDPEHSVRAAAIRSLASVGESAVELLPVMISMLSETNAYTMVGAIGELGPAGQPAVPALIKALESPDNKLRNNTANVLGRIGPGAKAAVPALIKTMNDKNPNVRRNAGFALWKIDGRTDLVRMVCEAIETEDEPAILNRRMPSSSRYQDIYTLSKMGSGAKEAIPVLERLMDGAPNRLRRSITNALAKIRGEAVLEDQ